MKPILFNTDMVRAILEGRKTVTRLLVKPQYGIDIDGGEHPFDAVVGNRLRWADHPNIWTAMPYPYHPGDILYVRETWERSMAGTYLYKATDTPFIHNGWRPSIHMPRGAARIFLRVTDLRVERLQESFFQHGSAIFHLQKEGIDIGEQCRGCIASYGQPCCIDDESECGSLDDVRGDFADLWDGTIKPADRAIYGWAANPWVWVIEFERISGEEAESE